MNVPLLTVMLLVATPLCGWGEKGHFLVNEAATRGVPNDMPAWWPAWRNSAQPLVDWRTP